MIDPMRPKPHRRRKPAPSTLSINPPPPTVAADFQFTMTKVAISQICRSVGFISSQQSALEALTRVATLYLETLAKTAASYANACSRTESNLFDVINSLHDLSSVQGFVGASTLQDSGGTGICLLSSGVLNDLAGFVNSTEEIPFAKSIPRENPIPPPMTRPSSYSSAESRGGHIPRWLPEFPDESTGRECDVGCDKSRDLKLWEDSDLVRSCGGDGSEFRGVPKEESRAGGNMAVERRRVKFKISRAEYK